MSGLLTELADVLSNFGDLRCLPDVETDEDGCVVLTVRVKPSDQPTIHQATAAMELGNELQWVCDVAKMRMYAERYNIDPSLLEAAMRGGQHGS